MSLIDLIETVTIAPAKRPMSLGACRGYFISGYWWVFAGDFSRARRGEVETRERVTYMEKKMENL